MSSIADFDRDEAWQRTRAHSTCRRGGDAPRSQHPFEPIDVLDSVHATVSYLRRHREGRIVLLSSMRHSPRYAVGQRLRADSCQQARRRERRRGRAHDSQSASSAHAIGRGRRCSGGIDARREHTRIRSGDHAAGEDASRASATSESCSAPDDRPVRRARRDCDPVEATLGRHRRGDRRAGRVRGQRRRRPGVHRTRVRRVRDGGVRSGVVDAAIAKLRSSSFDARTRAVGGAVAAAGAVEEALVLAFALAFASNDLSIPERGAIDALAEAMNAPVGALAHARALVRGVIDAG